MHVAYEEEPLRHEEAHLLAARPLAKGVGRAGNARLEWVAVLLHVELRARLVVPACT